MKARARVLLVAALAVVACAPALASGQHVGLEGYPLSFEGRVMPLESAAELVLYRLSGRRSIEGRDATEWLAGVLAEPFAAADEPLFLVNNPGVFDAVGLAFDERDRYSYLELRPALGELTVLAASLASVERELDALERELVALANNVSLFEGIASTLDVFRAAEGPSGYEQLLAGERVAPGELTEIPGMMRLIPLSRAGETRWLTPASAVGGLSAVREFAATGGAEPVLELLGAWQTITNASPEARRDAVPRVLAAVAAASPPHGRTRLAAELLHDRLRPTLWAALAAIAALCAGIVSSHRPRAGRVVAPLLGVATLFLTMHQLLRFLVMRRPPVTDLPSSFLFVAWVLATIGLVLSLRSNSAVRSGAIVGGTAALMVYFARLVTGGADQFGVVQAILDTNFWLTTHVLVITSGYATVIAAGVFGHLYLVRRLISPGDAGRHSRTGRTVLVLLVTGLALTFLGTMLGGIWADQSWGRFWGWDPKENGALLIILWISVALHARVTRWIDEAGFAAAAVFGVAVVFFSWLGVNLMGVGLHSYGFHDASFWVVVAVVGGETIFALTSWLLVARTRSAGQLVRTRVTEVMPDGDATLVSFTGTGGSHAPGQYLGVRPDGFRLARPFSLVDLGDGVSRFLVRPNGRLSTSLARELRPGDRIAVSRAAGTFTLRPGAGEVVLVAGGVGIAPIVGLARAALAAGRRVVLVRSVRDHFYLDHAVTRLKESRTRLTLVSIMSRPPESWTGLRGRVSPAALADADVPRDADWYICGSPEFCDGARAVARALGAGAIYEEAFHTVSEQPAAPTFRSHARYGDRVIDVLPGETLLEAALRSGVAVPHSCDSGTCSECSCRIRSGRAVQAVEPASAGPGDELRLCVAYPSDPDGLAVEPPGGTRSGGRSPA
ncbi:MAG: cytochrome c biogenesis protein CcsA [Spirochaetota bacterium]